MGFKPASYLSVLVEKHLKGKNNLPKNLGVGIRPLHKSVIVKMTSLCGWEGPREITQTTQKLSKSHRSWLSQKRSFQDVHLRPRLCPPGSLSCVNFSRTKISTHKFLTTCLKGISTQLLMLKLLTESGSKLYLASHFSSSKTEAPTNQWAENSMDQNQGNYVRWWRSQEENRGGYVNSNASPTLLETHQSRSINCCP